METNKIGKEAVLIGSIVGGNVVGAIATNKMQFLKTDLGRIALIVLGAILASKAKSDILKGAAIGVALSGATPFAQKLAGGVSGFEGLMGVDGNYGVGDIIQGPDGMMYMVNGLGELEPYMDGLEGDEDYYLEGDEDYLEGDEVDALASTDDETAILA